VYQEAMAWSLGFGMLTLNLAWRRSVAHGWAPWWALVTAGVLAANSRPTMALVCFVLGVWFLARVPRRPERSWRELFNPALLALLPALTVMGVWMVKFGEPIPDLKLNEEVPERPWWRDVLDRNGGATAGPVFIPTALVVYLRPDGIEFNADAPFIDLRFTGGDITFVPPLAKGGAYSESTLSVTDVMPLAVVSLAAIVPLARRRRRKSDAPSDGPDPDSALAALGALAVAAAACVVLTLTNVAMTLRYLPDFYPLAVVALAAACVALPAGAVDRARWRVILVVGAAWSTWVALGVMWRLNFWTP
jgi:hypothetical protein